MLVIDTIPDWGDFHLVDMVSSRQGYSTRPFGKKKTKRLCLGSQPVKDHTTAQGNHRAEFYGVYGHKAIPALRA